MAIQILLPNNLLLDSIDTFFRKIRRSNDANRFHPHDFSRDFAINLCRSEYNDLYYFIVDFNNFGYDWEVIAYGMLRGWDEGYNTPFLGIYVSKEFRGRGVSKLLMNFLHFAAKNKGAEFVKLKVYKSNIPAINLYKSLGYELIDYDEDQYLGTLKL